MSTARVAYAAGEDGVFPKFFGKIHPKYDTPANAIIIGSVLVNILLVMNYQKSMVSSFTFITILATLSYLPVYLLTVAAEIMLSFKKGEKITLPEELFNHSGKLNKEDWERLQNHPNVGVNLLMNIFLF